MRIVQTLYTDSNTDILKDAMGWLAPEYHLMGWALSCLQLKKYYKEVHLYTNDHCAEIIINKLGLPYDYVHTIHNNFSLPHPDLWALSKIYTYSLQRSSFLHIDGDVFIFQALPKDLLKQPLIAQNEEVASKYYTSTQKNVQNHFTFIPDVVQKDFETKEFIHAANAGIIGGNDYDFFKEFVRLAFKYVNRNISNLSLINASKFNVFFEQHLFYCYAKSQDINIAYLLDELFQDNKFVGLGNFWEVPFERTFLHLLGEFKQNASTCNQLATKLRAYYPEYYYKIIALFKKNQIPLKYDYYSPLDSSSAEVLNKYFFSAKKEYKVNCKSEGNAGNDHPNLKKTLQIITQSKEHHYLSTKIDNVDCNKKGLSRSDLKSDYHQFLDQVAKKISSRSFSLRYLYGRDIHSEQWYSMVFKGKRCESNLELVTCPEISIISSKYNWGAFWSKVNQPGVPYYKTLQLKQDKYFALLVHEAYECGFSIYDLEALDTIILNMLAHPISINEIIIRSKEYFEEDVIENNMSDIQNLIMQILQRLILKKAVKPYEKV